MSTSAIAMMTITDRQKCFEERKELASHPCTVNHYVNLGVDIDSGVLLTPDSSPSSLSSSSYQESFHQSTESLASAPPPISRCSVLTMPTSPIGSDSEPGPYIHGTAYNQVGSPYSMASSPGNQIFSPQNQQFEHQLPPTSTHMLPPPQMGSPPYGSHSPSPYQSTIMSPGQYSVHSSKQVPTTSAAYHSQTTMDHTAVEGVPQLIPYSSCATTCSGIPTVFDAMTGEPAIYSIPGSHQMPVLETYSMHPNHLPPFSHMFEGSIPSADHPDRHTPTKPFCPSEPSALPIKQIPNEFGVGAIEFYHPPTPPTTEGHPGMICHVDMCVPHPSHLHPELCGPLPPLPPHLCSIPTLTNTNSRRRPKQQRKVPQIEVDDSDIKDIPTSAQLWEFTLRVLKKPKYKYMVSWEKREEGLFRFNNAQAFAALWGKHRNRPQMSYDKVARALRYYYKRNILEQVGGRLTYRFTKRLSKMYLSDV